MARTAKEAGMDAVRIANDTESGLAAGLWSTGNQLDRRAYPLLLSTPAS